jgi:hypothetical protein
MRGRIRSLILLPAIVTAACGATLGISDVGEVVASMLTRDGERQANLHGYTATRRYVLESPTHHERAEMLVRIVCQEDGSKQFEVVSSSGWGAARKHVFPQLLQAEAEAARPDVREQSRITPENYTFEMAAIETIRGRRAYVIAIQPRTANKYLTTGRIWVDTDEFAILRIEGKPARNPSFWIRRIHLVHDYDKSGQYWFPVSDRSLTDVRIFGGTEMTIEYFDYAPNASPAFSADATDPKSLP